MKLTSENKNLIIDVLSSGEDKNIMIALSYLNEYYDTKIAIDDFYQYMYEAIGLDPIKEYDEDNILFLNYDPTLIEWTEDNVIDYLMERDFDLPSKPKSNLFKSAWDLVKKTQMSLSDALKTVWAAFKMIGKEKTFTFIKVDKSFRTVTATIIGLKGNVALYKENDQIKSFRMDWLISSN